MEYLLVPTLTLFASVLTFFSGFGLGTILLPVFAIFFPVSISIVLTAIVHFINNLFKLVAIGKHANKSVVVRFGLPAFVAAFIGAVVLGNLSLLDTAIIYTIFEKDFFTSYLKIIIGLLIIIFAILELLPSSKFQTLSGEYLPLAGILSGFFGGLSGHQGALRSAFLLKYNLSKEAFIGTGVVIACLVDLSRIIGYGYLFNRQIVSENILLLSLCTVFALVGVLIGNKIIKKTTFKSIQLIVCFMLIAIGFLLMAGVV